MSIMNVADLKQQVVEAVAKFGGQLDWSNFSADPSIMAEYLKQVRDVQQEGQYPVYRAFIVKHKTKRGYSPKTIKYRKLFGYYTSKMEIEDGVAVIHNYIRPLPAVVSIKITKGVLNEGTKTV